MSKISGTLFIRQPCIDCGELTRVRDHDEPAVCVTCARERRVAEAQAREEAEQAGAQHVGRERETRDVRASRTPDEVVRALFASRRLRR